MMIKKFLKWKYIIIGAFLLVLIFNFKIGDNIHLYTKNSSYSPGYFGGKIYFLLLKELGYRVISWEEPLSSIEQKGCVIFILSPLFDFEEKDTEFLKAWVHSGGILIIADEENNAAFREFGIVPYYGSSVEREQDVSPIPSRISGDTDLVKISTNIRLKFEGDPEKEIILVDEKGVIMAMLAYGKGNIIAASCPEIFMNDMIRKADNSILAVNCTFHPSGQVYFDEYHHGYKKKMTLFSVLDMPMRLFLLQLVCAILLLFHQKGKRFQTPRPADRESPRKGIEFVHIMAHLFERAHARTYILSILLQNFKNRVALKMGIAQDADIPVIASALAQKGNHEESTIIEVCNECEEAVRKGRISSKQLLKLARALDTIGKEEIFNGK